MAPPATPRLKTPSDLGDNARKLFGLSAGSTAA